MHIGCYGFKAFQTKPKPRKSDGGHEKTWPDQQKDNDKDNDNDHNKDRDKDNSVSIYDF